MKSLNQLLSLVLLAAGILFFNSQAQAITLKACVGYKFVPIIGFEEYTCWAKGKRYVVTGTRFGLEASVGVRGVIKFGGKKITGEHCGVSFSFPGIGCGPDVGVRGSRKDKSLSVEAGLSCGIGASVGSCVQVREYGKKYEEAKADPSAPSWQSRAFGVDQ